MDLETRALFLVHSGPYGSSVWCHYRKLRKSNANGTLALTFSKGDRLTLADSSREYESYQITRPGETIVV
jgi:hypothetical protein